MSATERMERVIVEAMVWLPATGYGTLHPAYTPDQRKARRRFDYHLSALSKELGWNELDGMLAHLTAVHVAENRLAESTHQLSRWPRPPKRGASRKCRTT